MTFGQITKKLFKVKKCQKMPKSLKIHKGAKIDEKSQNLSK